MSLSINPVRLNSANSLSFGCTGSCKTCSAATCMQEVEFKPETVASAEFAGDKLRVSTAAKGWLDSNVWYQINKDGSALIQTAWSLGSDVKAGTYTEIYNEAKAINDKSGKISDEEALALTEKIRAIDIINKN